MKPDAKTLESRLRELRAQLSAIYQRRRSGVFHDGDEQQAEKLAHEIAEAQDAYWRADQAERIEARS